MISPAGATGRAAVSTGAASGESTATSEVRDTGEGSDEDGSLAGAGSALAGDADEGSELSPLVSLPAVEDVAVGAALATADSSRVDE